MRRGANGRGATNAERWRVELADFLRSRRASLQPENVGLPNGGRRGTPGLRREEVELHHPAEGMLAFSHAVFHPAEVPEQRLILYSPLPDHDTPAKLARLLQKDLQTPV